jgi:hypothetical protein
MIKAPSASTDVSVSQRDDRHSAPLRVHTALRQAQDEEARAWTPPQGHADIAPSRYKRIEGDGYLTIDAHWVVPALLRSVPIEGRVLERPPARSRTTALRLPSARRASPATPCPRIPSTDPRGRRR